MLARHLSTLDLALQIDVRTAASVRLRHAPQDPLRHPSPSGTEAARGAPAPQGAALDRHQTTHVMYDKAYRSIRNHHFGQNSSIPVRIPSLGRAPPRHGSVSY